MLIDEQKEEEPKIFTRRIRLLSELRRPGVEQCKLFCFEKKR